MTSRLFCILLKPRSGTSRFILLAPALLVLVLLLPLRFARPAPPRDDWQPIPPADLALKENPANPGSPAMILLLENFTHDGMSYETYFWRLKIFSDAGRKYADVEIPFFAGETFVKDIKARTVHADGSVVIFDGQVFEKEVIKVGDHRELVKAFTLPDVQPGSVIEYKYRLEWGPSSLFNSSWILQSPLFIRQAVFSIFPRRPPGLSFHWLSYRIPPTNNGIEKQKDGSYKLIVDGIPAFEEEDFMPPENELMSRIDRYYTPGALQTPEQYWKETGKALGEGIEKFANKKQKVEELVRQVVSPADSPEEKLHKIYARAQQVRNVLDEPPKTKEEARKLEGD